MAENLTEEPRGLSLAAAQERFMDGLVTSVAADVTDIDIGDDPQAVTQNSDDGKFKWPLGLKIGLGVGIPLVVIAVIVVICLIGGKK